GRGRLPASRGADGHPGPGEDGAAGGAPVGDIDPLACREHAGGDAEPCGGGGGGGDERAGVGGYEGVGAGLGVDGLGRGVRQVLAGVALRAFGSFWPLDSLYALLALWSLVALRSLLALRTLLALRSFRTFGAGGELDVVDRVYE